MPRPLAHGSTSSSRSRAVVASSRTQNTQPAGTPSTSAIQAASASGSRFSAKSATILATRASYDSSQPNSSAYTAPFRWITQPMSPGRGARSR